MDSGSVFWELGLRPVDLDLRPMDLDSTHPDLNLGIFTLNENTLVFKVFLTSAYLETLSLNQKFGIILFQKLTLRALLVFFLTSVVILVLCMD